jgi:hypothetical protein
MTGAAVTMPKGDLDAFHKELRRVAGRAKGFPFVCRGNPFDCDTFVVGINPATTTPFWPCWSAKTGFNKDKWLGLYKKHHGDFTPTRQRIEILCHTAGQNRVLETNVFTSFARRENKLAETERTTDVFEFLMDCLNPRVMFVHGRTAIQSLERLVNARILKHGKFVRVQHRRAAFDVIAGRHLCLWSYARVQELGEALRERCKIV